MPKALRTRMGRKGGGKKLFTVLMAFNLLAFVVELLLRTSFRVLAHKPIGAVSVNSASNLPMIHQTRVLCLPAKT